MKKRKISIEARDAIVGSLAVIIFIVLCGAMFVYLFPPKPTILGIIMCLMTADVVGLIAYAGWSHKNDRMDGCMNRKRDNLSQDILKELEELGIREGRASKYFGIPLEEFTKDEILGILIRNHNDSQRDIQAARESFKGLLGVFKK